MTHPLVTVIIPLFNRSNYIDQTICSVLNQSYDNIELIVIDDGSTDGSYEKAKSYSNKLTLLTHDNHENRGQSASINLGLSKATGKYIAILDSDDYWDYNKISLQVDFLEKHNDIGLVYTNGHGVDSNGNIIYTFYRNDHNEPNDPNAVLLDCYILLPQNSLVRKTVYDVVGQFNDTYRAAQDHDMLIRIAEVTKFAYLTDYTFYYRHHGDSISGKNQMVRWKNGFKILASAKKRYPYKNSTIRKRKAVLNYRVGSCFFKERKYINALCHMSMAFFLDPLRAIAVVSGFEKVY